MSLTLEPFTTWIDRKRREIAAEEPLSIQTNIIATLTHELNIAQCALEKIRTIHRPDPTTSWCVHCQWEWPCRTYTYAGGGA